MVHLMGGEVPVRCDVNWPRPFRFVFVYSISLRYGIDITYCSDGERAIRDLKPFL